MKVEQLCLPMMEPALPQACNVKTGECFLYQEELYMRVKPVSWILNSTIFQEKLAAGFIVCVWAKTGKLGFLKGTEQVQPVNSTVSWSKGDPK